MNFEGAQLWHTGLQYPNSVSAPCIGCPQPAWCETLCGGCRFCAAWHTDLRLWRRTRFTRNMGTPLAQQTAPPFESSLVVSPKVSGNLPQSIDKQSLKQKEERNVSKEESKHHLGNEVELGFIYAHLFFSCYNHPMKRIWSQMGPWFDWSCLTWALRCKKDW